MLYFTHAQYLQQFDRELRYSVRHYIYTDTAYVGAFGFLDTIAQNVLQFEFPNLPLMIYTFSLVKNSSQPSLKAFISCFPK